MNDMETETELLERHLEETWEIVGEMECEAWGRSIPFIAISAMFFLCYWMGPGLWMMVIVLASCIGNILFNGFFKSHFSKKYMRLANGE